MNFILRHRLLLLAVLGMLAASAFFYQLGGRSIMCGWPIVAVHNWQQYGLGELHGKLVTNPGGFEVLTKPDIYKGHRAASMYPVYAAEKLLDWAGDGEVMAHLALTLALFFSVWFLMGRGGLAVVTATAVALCPSYSVYPAVLDPNSMALYPMLAYAALVIPIFTAPTISPLQLALLAVITYAYTSLNWISAFGHGIFFCALLAMPSVSWARLRIYLGLAGLSVGVVGGLSVLDKMGVGQSAGAPVSFQAFLAGYTWGHSGYGEDLTTVKAMVRLGVVNSIGLLPLLALLVYLLAKLRKSGGGRILPALLPFTAAALGVMSMRNYFGHHPWMAAPLLLPGLVLSLALLRRQIADETRVQPGPLQGALFLLGCGVYALLVVGAYRAYHAENLDVLALIRQHTARADTIVLVENLDARLAFQAGNLAENGDRRLVVLPTLETPVTGAGNFFVLSATNLSGRLPVVARSEKPALLSSPLVRKLSAWYASHIARRRFKDQPMEQHAGFSASTDFALYRLNQPARP